MNICFFNIFFISLRRKCSITKQLIINDNKKRHYSNLLLCIEICGDGGPKPFSDEEEKAMTEFVLSLRKTHPTRLNKNIKRRFKNEVFTPLIREDIDKFGKPKNNFHSAYIGIDWALQNFVDKQPMEDSDEEE